MDADKVYIVSGMSANDDGCTLTLDCVCCSLETAYDEIRELIEEYDDNDKIIVPYDKLLGETSEQLEVATVYDDDGPVRRYSIYTSWFLPY